MASGTIIVDSWQYVGASTGNTAIAIPSTAKEVTVTARYGTSNLVYNLRLIREQLSGAAATYTQGYYLSASSYGICQISASLTNVSLTYLGVNGTDYTSTSSISVWAK